MVQFHADSKEFNNSMSISREVNGSIPSSFPGKLMVQLHTDFQGN
jgi:hypothetical protein